MEEISIGSYVLTGGELPSAIIVDAVARHIPSVLGKEESLEEERGMSGFPLYTKPEIFVYKGKKYRAPKVLLSGHHKNIEGWREKNAKKNLNFDFYLFGLYNTFMKIAINGFGRIGRVFISRLQAILILKLLP